MCCVEEVELADTAPLVFDRAAAAAMTGGARGDWLLVGVNNRRIMSTTCSGFAERGDVVLMQVSSSSPRGQAI
jgi:hypothetical protein